MKPRSPLPTLLLGLLPVVAYALVENYYGTLGGLIAGIAFGIGEVAYEWFQFKKVQNITLIANALVVILGGLSLFESNPVFFKLQPAILVFLFAGLLIVSSILKKPFLVEMAKKQSPDLPAVALERLRGLNLRLGFLMVAIGALSVYAAYFWSTKMWALLKGVGVPILLILYMGIEVFVIRLLRPKASAQPPKLH